MKRFALIALLGLATTAAQADGGTPAQLAERCTACHGPGGAKPIAPDYPIIAGQYANYLAKALTEYKEGKRKNPIMGAQAAQLSAQDIEGLAEYFDGLPTTLYTPTEQGETK